ncbi:hypothetical protein KY342_02840 [Candidatus Woesearchaeota archaeon]|nr:hypothetical protein [Candidatus Woesearchaeota archaeon]
MAELEYLLILQGEEKEFKMKVKDDSIPEIGQTISFLDYYNKEGSHKNLPEELYDYDYIVKKVIRKMEVRETGEPTGVKFTGKNLHNIVIAGYTLKP